MKFNSLYCYKYKDQYNIYNIIKKINKHYTLYYNTKDKCFIVVNTANFNEICLNFDNLSLNIEKLLNYSSVKNLNNLIEYIDKSNKYIQDKQINKLKEHTTNACNECLNLIKKASKISKLDIDKIIGESNA